MSNFLDQINESNKGQQNVRITEHMVEVDSSYKKKKQRKVLWYVGSGIIIVAVSFVLIQQVTMVKVPDFIGKTKVQMQQWCIESGISYNESAVYDMEMESDYVMEQSVSEGKKIGKRHTLEAVVSKGADPSESIVVPDLMVMTPSEIKNWVSQYQLSNTNLQEEANNQVEKGNVIRYEFKNLGVDESNFTRGESLTVYVSSGKKKSQSAKAVPDFSGKTREDVEQWATTNHMNVKIKETISSKVSEQGVVSQSIEEGTVVEPTEKIVVKVSAGAGIKVPDFSKASKEEAETMYAEFTVRVNTRYTARSKYGAFLSQSVEAGKKVKSTDNTVTVVYALGQPYMPELLGRSESELPELFYEFNQKGTNFTYTVKYVDHVAPKGTIVKASKSAEYVSLQENIQIQVSKGNVE